ncbi:MAG TPA: helix-turn-helix domain-containing protein [Candidatus Wunengus sp. YC61]|uniref:helix-turn-helix domain-containing protein n=1 Tax=Candidatus Wunengus sp. YC61 TaxID=3367698 RepID=UPI00402805F7
MPDIKFLIAHKLADGWSQAQIAQALGTSQPTISRIARRDDVREIIKKEEKKNLKTVETILAKIQKDPVFLNKYQEEVEKMLLKGLGKIF